VVEHSPAWPVDKLVLCFQSRRRSRSRGKHNIVKLALSHVTILLKFEGLLKTIEASRELVIYMWADIAPFQDMMNEGKGEESPYSIEPSFTNLYSTV